MEIRKVIMKNGNEYKLLWDVERVSDSLLHLIDLKVGWIKIKQDSIGEEYSIGKLKENTPLHPKIKALIKEYYGEEVFLE